MQLGGARPAPKTSPPESGQSSPSLKLPADANMPDWLKKKLKSLQECALHPPLHVLLQKKEETA